MYVGAADHMGAAAEPARLAHPLAALGPLTMVACGTPAGGSPLRTGETHDAALLTLVPQIIDVLAVLPLRHALVVDVSTEVPNSRGIQLCVAQSPRYRG